MTFVVLPGRPPHPGIVQDDATDVWKSSGRLWPSRRRTTGKIVGSQSGLLRAASWRQGNLRNGAEYGPTAVCRTGIYTLWAKYGCLTIASVSRGCPRSSKSASWRVLLREQGSAVYQLPAGTVAVGRDQNFWGHSRSRDVLITRW